MIFLFLIILIFADDNPLQCSLGYRMADTASTGVLCTDFPAIAWVNCHNDITTIDWSVSDDCVVNSQNDFGNELYFSCITPGAHKVSVVVNGSAYTFERELDLIFSGCNELHWYLMTKYSDTDRLYVKNGSVLEIWPVSSMAGSEAELAGVALNPSGLSSSSKVCPLSDEM